MKKLLMALVVLLSIGMLYSDGALASPPPMETKLIVESYELDKTAVPAGESCTLQFTIKNTNQKQFAQNITVWIKPLDGAFLPEGKNTLYIPKLDKGNAVTCAFGLKAALTAVPGTHAIEVQIKYEDGKGTALTVQTELMIESAQPAQTVRIRADVPESSPANAAEPVTVKVDVHNLGKVTLYNLSALAKGGQLKMIKDVYSGNLESGQSKTLEIIMGFDASVAEDVKMSDAWKSVKPGGQEPMKEYSAELLLTYEDASGKEYNQRLAFTAKANVPKPEEPVYAVPDKQVAAAPAPDITGWVVAGVALVAMVGAILLALWKARKRGTTR